MIDTALSAMVHDNPDELFLIDRGTCWTRKQSLERSQLLSRVLAASGCQRLLLYMHDSADLVHWLLAASIVGVESAIANRLTPLTELGELAAAAESQSIVSDIEPDAVLPIPRISECSTTGDPTDLRTIESSERTVVIFTSGTTAKPKGSRYRWGDLLAQVRRREDQHQTRWILLYQLNHFAGFQVLSHVMGNSGSLVIPHGRTADVIHSLMKEWNVTHASGTPTFWRLFCGHVRETIPSIRQVTLGGEASTDDLLARLRNVFPEAVISQVYATTELGSCFSVNDGRAGFPATLLNNNDREVQLRIVDGELQVKPRYGMKSYTQKLDGPQELPSDDGWKSTGDVVEVVGDRVLFRGRTSETINVGGVKVHPLAVESVIAAVEGVLATRVYGQPNPISGALVVAEIVLAPSADRACIEPQIREACRMQLTRYQQPRLIHFVDELATVNSKVMRRATMETPNA